MEHGVSSGAAPGRRKLAAAAVVAFCVALAAIHTWPLATAPGRLSRNDNGDTLLNTWAIAWVAHELPRDPAHLFDANIFWPERRTLGYSESMVVQGVMAMPILALGGSPVLAYNLVLLLGFALTAAAFGLLAHRWTGSLAAALVAASAAAFNSHTLLRLPHLQTQHLEFLALALVAMDGIFTRQRVRDGFSLGLAFALQALTSIYVMTFSAWAMCFGALARLVRPAPARRVRALGLLALAALVAAAVLAPYLWEYYRIHADQGFARGFDLNGAARWENFLASGSRLHFDWWSARFVEVSQSKNFPGFTVLLLTIVALASSAVRKDPRARMCAAIAFGCLGVAAVPWTPVYELVIRTVPLFWAVRVQAHIGQIVLVMLAVLAGFGVARIERAWGARRGWTVVAAGLVVMVNGEALRSPLVYKPFGGIPAVYDVLRDEPRAVVAEIPLYETRHFFQNAPYMLNSTRHWHPILNGYSGFFPVSYVRAAEALRRFPDYDALALLHERSVTHVVVHKAALVARSGPAAFDAIREISALRLVADDGEIYIYRFK